MIEKVRGKFVLMTMVIVVSLFVAFFGAILLSTHLNNRTQAYEVLDEVIDYVVKNGAPPSAEDIIITENKINRIRSFVAITDTDSIQYIEPSYYDERFFAKEEVVSYVSRALKKEKDRGQIGNVFYAKREISAGRSVVAGLDLSLENTVFNRLALSVVIIFVAAVCLIFMGVWFLSYKVVEPVQESLSKQKEFISDASHEMKTPITVISASNEMLAAKLQEMGLEESLKWTNNISLQTQRMSGMATDLLTLSKIDELDKPQKYTKFDLSKVVLAAVLPFESVAFEKNKKFDLDIEDNIEIESDKNAVMQIASILTENAIKHSDENAEIKISLKRDGNRSVLSVFNTGSKLKPGEKHKLFERFYRSDDSRANSLGSGLGLSIAKAHADLNKWKISILTEPENTITFVVTM